jgi:hypothetical protein
MTKTKELINEMVVDVKENIENNNLQNSDDIREHLNNSNIFYSEDLIVLYKENKECGLSEIGASSVVVGENVFYIEENE